MGVTPLTDHQFQRLSDLVMAKMLARKEVIALAEGEITIRIFKKGEGFDVKIGTLT